MRDPTVVIRIAHDDDDVIRRLAELDEQDAPAGPVLLALVDGEPVAALSLADGRAVADPFVAAEEPLALLRLRAKHLSRRTTRRGINWRRQHSHGRDD